MATTKLGDSPVNTNADLLAIGSVAPEFTLTGADFSPVGSPPDFDAAVAALA